MNRAIFCESAVIRTFRRVLLATGAVALIASLAGCAHVPFSVKDAGVNGPATITGQVSSERGAIIADADVLLASSKTSSSGGPTVRRQTKTDITGRFTFEQVPLGTYVVTASPTGYKATKQKLTVEKEGTVRTDLKVRM